MFQTLFFQVRKNNTKALKKHEISSQISLTEKSWDKFIVVCCRFWLILFQNGQFLHIVGKELSDREIDEANLKPFNLKP